MTFVPNCISYFCAVTCSFGHIMTPLGTASAVAETPVCNKTHALLIRTCSWLSFLKNESVVKSLDNKDKTETLREELMRGLPDCMNV